MTIWLDESFRMQFRVIDGLTIRFARSQDRGRDALLLSPWPESLLAFLPVWAQLAQDACLVAIDLPGFGHSQRSDALLSPRAMAGFVIRVADAFGLEQPHVVGPDVGTAVALFAAAEHPGRLRSLVVGGGAAAVPLQLGGVLQDWAQAPGPAQDPAAAHAAAAQATGPRPMVASVLAGLQRYPLPDAVREDYLSSYDGDRFAATLRYLRSYPADLPVLRDLLPEIQTPVQIIAGHHDTAVPAVNARFLRERLPRSRLDLVNAGHFTWEDAADDYALLVARWWAGGYAAT